LYAYATQMDNLCNQASVLTTYVLTDQL